MANIMLRAIVIVLLAQISAVIAQTAFPTNATLPSFITSSQGELLLQWNDGSMQSGPQVTLDIALDASSGRQTLNETLFANSSNSIDGPLILTLPSQIDKLTNNSLAYISCDPLVYSNSNLNLQDTIRIATQKVSPTGDPAIGAIILYTTTSTWCNYSQTDLYNFSSVFIIPNLNGPSALKVYMSLTASQPVTASIYNGQITSQNGNFNPSSTDATEQNQAPATPSTTIAMIILYSVTGIITLCFVTVIVSGAVRARRHPERYGLLNLPGGSHQRRARGIARAMLETIPIVKFGEKEPTKTPADLEQGTEMRNVANTTNTNNNADTPRDIKPVIATEASHPRGSIDAAAPAESSESPAATSAPVDEATEELAENGLACSVCTEDFVKGQDLRVLPCNHKFHPECIDPWLLNVSGTCPLCRIDLRPPEEREAEAHEAALAAERYAVPSDIAARSHRASLAQAPWFSMFLHRGRMGEATPAQRIRALRDLRNHRRNMTGTVPGETPTEETVTEASTSRSNRVSRFFTRRDGSPPVSTAEPVPDQAGNRTVGPDTSPATEDPAYLPSPGPLGSAQGSTTRSSRVTRHVPSLHQTGMNMRRGR